MNRRGKSKDSGRRGQGAGREDDDEGHLDDDDDDDDMMVMMVKNLKLQVFSL